MIIANFTPDAINWQYAGATGTLKPGAVEKFDNRAQANTILNKYGPRGILELEWNDNVDTKKTEALRIYKAWWTRQITNFNQDNERRKNTNREYVTPTAQLQAHADELGIETLGPWAVKQNDNEALKTLRDENLELRGQVGMLMEQVKGLVEAVKSRTDIPFEMRTTAEKRVLKDEPKEELVVPKVVEKVSDGSVEAAVSDNSEYAAIIKEFKYLQRDDFSLWVMTNISRIQDPTFPAAVVEMIKSKWERLIQGNWPVPA